MSSPRKQLQGILTSVDMNISSINIDNTICDNLDKMNISDDTNTKTNIILLPTTCANCGKEGNDVLNTCNKCNSVKYCNAACKKKHRHKHKKECERRIAELHDEALFKQPPPEEDCPICFLRMPCLVSARMYMSCCGKDICCGCNHASKARDKKRASLCPFCRTPASATAEELIQRYKKRIELNDAAAINDLGGFYHAGMHGLHQNYTKGMKLWHRSGDLGCAEAYFNIGLIYEYGRGVGIDKKKAEHYYELAAMGGDSKARHNLGVFENNKGNMDRALKHYMIAVEGGLSESLDDIKELYTGGYATKEDYGTALRAHQSYMNEIKSHQRDQAAEASDDNKYY